MHLLISLNVVRIAVSLVFSVMFCISLFILLSFFFTIALSILFRFTTSDYPLDISKIFLECCRRFKKYQGHLLVIEWGLCVVVCGLRLCPVLLDINDVILSALGSLFDGNSDPHPICIPDNPLSLPDEAEKKNEICNAWHLTS